MINCTFNGNVASNNGGAVYSLKCNPSIKNCIIWGNIAKSGSEIYNLESKPTVKNCVIKGGYEGGTDIVITDPQLMGLGNYGSNIPVMAVSSTSSAIGKGLSDTSIPTTDARGVSRATPCTIGAYEYVSTDNFADKSCSITVSGETLKTNEAFTITATANAIEYKLYKNGELVATQTGNVFTITETEGGTYTYRVEATLANGSVVSSSMLGLLVSSPEMLQKVFYVRTTIDGSSDGKSWSTAFTDVQTAIDAASLVAKDDDPKEVWIAKGTYTPGASIVMKNNVHIYGGFAGTEEKLEDRVSGNETILSGENKRRVINNNYVSANRLLNTAWLDGVTIANGSNGSGGGMHLEHASPKITNCKFKNNNAYSYYGGAIYISTTSFPLFEDCVFENNSAKTTGGAIYGTKGTYRRCVFRGNTAIESGGAICCYGSTIIEDCVFENNSSNINGGAICLTNSGTIKNCTFVGNRALENGGAIANISAPSTTIINCTFNGNVALNNGGAIYSLQSNPSIINCSFSDNVATSTFNKTRGGAIYNYLSNPTIKNCILWDDGVEGEKILVFVGEDKHKDRYGKKDNGNHKGWENGNGNNKGEWIETTAAVLGNEIYNVESTPTIKNCIIEGGYEGAGTYSNIINEDPLLSPLGNYGGNIQTMPVSDGSPAISAGIGYDADKTIPTTDARGYARSTSAPTLGATELQEDIEIGDVQINITCKHKNKTGKGHEKHKHKKGEKVTLVCLVEGNGYTYQWYKNGEAIEGATTSTYELAEYDDEAEYTCKVFKKLMVAFFSGEYSLIDGSGEDETIIETDEDAFDSSVEIASGGFTLETVDASRLYVALDGSDSNSGTSWKTPLKSLQKAIDILENCYDAEIWIKAGEYQVSTPLKMKEGVAIYGGFAGTETELTQRVSGNETILDGQGISQIFNNNYEGSTALSDNSILEGVTIANAKGTLGGGIYNKNANPIIDNCKFKNCSAEKGAGIYNDSSTPVVANCTFDSNTANQGGGLYNKSSNASILNCTFVSNAGSGMYNYIADSKMSIGNCTFYLNTSENGSGMYNESASPTMLHCTFTKNTATTLGGGMYNASSNPNIINSIFWNNAVLNENNVASKEIYNDTSSSPVVNTCIIENGYTNGTGIYTDDPMLTELVDNGGQVKTIALANGSPAIGKGFTSEEMPVLSVDARGLYRNDPPTLGAVEVLYNPEYDKWVLENNLTKETSSPEQTSVVGTLTNLEKYAFGLSANSTTNYSSCVRQISNGINAGLEFSMKSDVKVYVLTSIDLINWEKMSITPTTIENGFSNYQVDVPIPEEGKVFLKLKVEEK